MFLHRDYSGTDKIEPAYVSRNRRVTDLVGLILFLVTNCWVYLYPEMKTVTIPEARGELLSLSQSQDPSVHYYKLMAKLAQTSWMVVIWVLGMWFNLQDKVDSVYRLEQVPELIRHTDRQIMNLPFEIRKLIVNLYRSYNSYQLHRKTAGDLRRDGRHYMDHDQLATGAAVETNRLSWMILDLIEKYPSTPDHVMGGPVQSRRSRSVGSRRPSGRRGALYRAHSVSPSS